MIVTYRLKSAEWTFDFFKNLKQTFAGKEISLRVEEIEDQDETEYLFSTEANRAHLLEAVEAVKTGNVYRSMTMKELDEMVQ